MSRIGIFAGAALLAVCAVSSAFAQQPQGVRLVGKVTAVDGPTLTIKTAEDTVKVSVTPNVMVIASSNGTIADVKKGDYIGVGASPQADGSQKAIRVNISPSRNAASAKASGPGIGPTPR